MLKIDYCNASALNYNLLIWQNVPFVIKNLPRKTPKDQQKHAALPAPASSKVKTQQKIVINPDLRSRQT
jgi:hypothetical protein